MAAQGLQYNCTPLAYRRMGLAIIFCMAAKGLLSWPCNSDDKLEKICTQLIDDVNIVPSLLHGDLWSGNYLVDSAGAPVLIDPAVYYGDREADLAMTKLFGSFGSDFYRAYNETFPLLPGYSERENLYKLYHILNHLNLFGTGYSSQVNSLINFYL